jgi:integrase
VQASRQTLEEYLATWLASIKHKVKPASFIRYEQVVRLHLIPGLGTIALAKLTAQQVQAFYAKRLDAGVTMSGVRSTHILLHAALDAAVRLDLVQRNVTDLVDKPKYRNRVMQVLTEGQARSLLATVAGDRLEALCVLALATGMREGELFALKWADVDLDEGWLQVRASVRRFRGGRVFQEPKSASGRRRIALSPAVVMALQRHRERQEEERGRLGDAWTDLDLVFPNQIGRPYDQYIIKRWFRPLLSRAGLPTIRFHDLRHTAATLLLSKGVNPKVVSEMLGHSTISITLGIYGHVLPHMQQHAARVMDQTLFE